jgi:hypothetical protein
MIEHVARWNPKGRSRTAQRAAAAGSARDAHSLHCAAASVAGTRVHDRGAVERKA